MKDEGGLSYRRCLGEFIKYVRWLQLNPAEAYEFDDLLLEYRHGTDMPPFMTVPSQSNSATTIAAVEKACPHF